MASAGSPCEKTWWFFGYSFRILPLPVSARNTLESKCGLSFRFMLRLIPVTGRTLITVLGLLEAGRRR